MELENKNTPETVVAIYTNLADAEAALYELESVGVPYPDIRMDTLTPGDLALTPLADRIVLGGEAPEYCWSLAVALEPAWADKAVDVLRKFQPAAVGTIPALERGRGDTERGAIAWRHYVFETGAATDAVGEYAGTTGTTGVISSGAFATGAKVEGNPPASGVPASDQRPSDKRQEPTGDTMRPSTSTDRSRPETELEQ